ncbi:glycosyltransferase family 2 protein [Bradyrhizobium arachidis]|uniref:Glycosyltransferase n=1 Tax=Bradyrhizobium arachidis TaxID=858423 RepID=A0AAE7TLA2_9BRAD|nr:glycosyltransferase [Bradyrhizobium arachidis]QOZ72938.1 glycosyltransferase [Bradyrhizobium arachidis]
MQDVLQPHGGGSPLFSIIIPLEFHRGQWEQSWLGWTSQTADKSLYEIILVMPPDFTAREELVALAGDAARIEQAGVAHDIGLCAFGAEKARGRYLFFTESHCRPEPDVIELCLRAIDAHPDWAGFSCRSVPICHNRLSVAEAAMYQADIEFGMKQHPWRKVLDQCFVTRRDIYWECGGLREEFGHFAEWVLAAAYHARGHAIGYLEEARFHHYYIGELGELKTFTLDFVRGEIRYLGEARSDAGSELLDIPIEWSRRDNFDVALARSTLAARMRSSHLIHESLESLQRWGPIALAGGRSARGSARISAAYARCVLTMLTMIGSDDSIARWLKRYIASLIHFQRLDCIHGSSETPGAKLPRLGDQVVAQAGFHAPEVWRQRSFRWSEPEAALRIELPQGRNTIRIASPEIREPLDRIGVRFYLDGVRVADVAISAGAFVLQLNRPSSGMAILAWTCPRFAAKGDERRLGLPVAGISIGAGEGANEAPSPAAMMRG